MKHHMEKKKEKNVLYGKAKALFHQTEITLGFKGGSPGQHLDQH